MAWLSVFLTYVLLATESFVPAFTEFSLLSTKGGANFGHFSDERISSVLSANLNDIDGNAALDDNRNSCLELLFNPTCVCVSFLKR